MEKNLNQVIEWLMSWKEKKSQKIEQTMTCEEINEEM